MQQANSTPEPINEGGGLAGLAWHTSPVKMSPGKEARLSQDNSFKITIPAPKQAETSDGTNVNFYIMFYWWWIYRYQWQFEL